MAQVPVLSTQQVFSYLGLQQNLEVLSEIWHTECNFKTFFMLLTSSLIIMLII